MQQHQTAGGVSMDRRPAQEHPRNKKNVKKEGMSGSSIQTPAAHQTGRHGGAARRQTPAAPGSGVDPKSVLSSHAPAPRFPSPHFKSLNGSESPLPSIWAPLVTFCSPLCLSLYPLACALHRAAAQPKPPLGDAPIHTPSASPYVIALVFCPPALLMQSPREVACLPPSFWIPSVVFSLRLAYRHGQPPAAPVGDTSRPVTPNGPACQTIHCGNY